MHELLTRAVEHVVPLDLAKKKLASGKDIRVYLGIDPTGNKLHLGHSVPLRKLKAFSDAGHHVIFLVGSFTAMVGDPSGRDSEREPLTREQTEENFKTYKKQAGKILDFTKVEVRYNHEWHDPLVFRDLLHIAGTFTVQQMLEREMFQNRLKQGKPISLTEFLYPIMQGYDSVMLDVDCELGGTDQLFNILAGRTLQQAFKKREKFAMTTKLIEGTDGRKMSKTYDNCVYLDETPKDMYGKLMSMNDASILPYMECCTDIPMAEIASAGKAMKGGANPKEYKMRLAREITKLYHGQEAATKTEEEFTKVFSAHGLPEDIQEIEVKLGTKLIDVLVGEKILPSKSEARRLIEQNGISINNTVVDAFDALAEAGIVKIGKRKFLRIVL